MGLRGKDQDVIHLAYGQGSIALHTDPKLAEWYIIRPRYAPPLLDAQQRFRAACRHPLCSSPLREIVRASDRVVVVTADGTRPVPNRLLIPWILQELPVPAEQVTVLLGNGSHRANTPAEIAAMFGEALVKKVEIVNHDAFDPQQNEYIGQTARGNKAYLNKLYLQADKRIVVGFIEPHFFAGFSGGAKGLVPGIAALDTILRIHSFDMIADPLSTWGIVEKNPIRRELEEMVSHARPDFMVNVTLNSQKEITALFVGHYIETHRQGCSRSKEEAMQSVPHAFPIVVTSNSGYPLDQNLYQTVKGISAAARITEPGGTIIIASECSDGIPAHGNFGELMRFGSSADDILARIASLEDKVLDQWEAQVYGYLMQKFEIKLFCAMERETVEACKLRKVNDLQAAVEESIRALGPRPRVAVLPDGPLTIPYLAE